MMQVVDAEEYGSHKVLAQATSRVIVEEAAAF